MIIVRCEDWGARPPVSNPVPAGKPSRIIFHHTFGHHPESSGPDDESVEEAKRYARQIQAFHMGPSRGWNDSGHNFLVCRNGVVLEGRHGSVDAIAKGRMVVSAHCPGQNDQPGIEHEHYKEAGLTVEQRRASVALHAWICRSTGVRPTEIYGHGHFFETSCPAELESEVMPMRLLVVKALATVNVYAAIPQEMFRWFLWRDRGSQPDERGQANVRTKVPTAWWARYLVHRGT